MVQVCCRRCFADKRRRALMALGVGEGLLVGLIGAGIELLFLGPNSGVQFGFVSAKLAGADWQ